MLARDEGIRTDARFQNFPARIDGLVRDHHGTFAHGCGREHHADRVDEVFVAVVAERRMHPLGNSPRSPACRFSPAGSERTPCLPTCWSRASRSPPRTPRLLDHAVSPCARSPGNSRRSEKSFPGAGYPRLRAVRCRAVRGSRENSGGCRRSLCRPQTRPSGWLAMVPPVATILTMGLAVSWANPAAASKMTTPIGARHQRKTVPGFVPVLPHFILLFTIHYPLSSRCHPEKRSDEGPALFVSFCEKSAQSADSVLRGCCFLLLLSTIH